MGSDDQRRPPRPGGDRLSGIVMATNFDAQGGHTTQGTHDLGRFLAQSRKERQRAIRTNMGFPHRLAFFINQYGDGTSTRT